MRTNVCDEILWSFLLNRDTRVTTQILRVLHDERTERGFCNDEIDSFAILTHWIGIVSSLLN